MDKDDLIALTMVIARQQRAIINLEAQLQALQNDEDKAE